MTIYGRPSVCIIAAYARSMMVQWKRERGRERGKKTCSSSGWGCRMVASCISAMCRVVTTQNGNANGGTTMQWAVNRTIVFIAIFCYNRTPPPPLFSFFDSFVFSFLLLWSYASIYTILYCWTIYFQSVLLYCIYQSVIFIIELRSDEINFLFHNYRRSKKGL